MEEIKYTKPALKFVGLRNKEKVANICFTNGGSNPNEYRYYDNKNHGYGWIKFIPIEVGGQNCTTSNLKIYYYSGIGATPEEITNLQDPRLGSLVTDLPSNLKSFQDADDLFPIGDDTNMPPEGWS